MTPPASDPPLSPGQRKSTVAAVVFLVMFLLSGTAMVWSGLQLWRGERLGPLYGLLPAGCERVVVVDEPDAAVAALATLAGRPGLPQAVTDEVRRLHSWLQASTAHKAWRKQAAWGVCELGGVGYAAVPLAEGVGLAEAASATSVWLERWMGSTHSAQPLRWTAERGRWAGRDGAGRVRAALRVATDPDGAVVQLAWQQTATTAQAQADAHTWLDSLQRLPADRTLQHDQAVREAGERVGGGVLHLFAAAAEVQRTAPQWIARGGPQLAEWREGLSHFGWFSAVVRADRGRLAVNLHLSGSQLATSFLKAHFDTHAELDGAEVLPAAAAERPQWGVLRSGPRGWAMLATIDPAAAQMPLHFPGERGAAFKAWEQLLAGPVAWTIRDGCLLAIAQLRATAPANLPADLPAPAAVAGCPPTVRRRQGPLLLSGPADRVDAAVRWLQGPASGRLADADADRKRLLADTQGWRRETAGGSAGYLQGPVQVEWVWVDTGLAAGVSWPLP
jgi:hypothetical protein